VVAGAAANPLAGARVHPRVSAPPLSGSVTVALSLASYSGGGPASTGLALFVPAARTNVTLAVV
jgi:hypothetical protein